MAYRVFYHPAPDDGGKPYAVVELDDHDLATAERREVVERHATEAEALAARRNLENEEN